MNLEILTHTVLPKSIHGINPRKIMGDGEWNNVKKEKQKIADHHCMCCGEYVPHIPGNYLQCHEIYSINIEKKEFELKDVVCICHKCHEFIHLGRLQQLLKEGKITQEYYFDIIDRGENLLKSHGLKKNNLSLEEINNPNWVLVYKNKKYNNETVETKNNCHYKQPDPMEFLGSFQKKFL